jgi:hypothetical protein
MAGRDRRGLNEKPDVLNHGVGVGLGEHVVARPGSPPPARGQGTMPFVLRVQWCGTAWWPRFVFVPSASSWLDHVRKMRGILVAEDRGWPLNRRGREALRPHCAGFWGDWSVRLQRQRSVGNRPVCFPNTRLWPRFGQRGLPGFDAGGGPHDTWTTRVRRV